MSTSRVTESRASAADIAIVGMAGRFPGARSVDEFWRNLCGGVESIVHFTREDLAAAGAPPSALEDPQFVPAAAPLSDVDLFDAAFFGYQPREAEIMDPQHRVLLECAWEALEDAGYCGGRGAPLTGVFVGAAANTYLLWHVTASPACKAVDRMQIHLGNADDFLATRISYKLNLNGPSVSVRTACSTSLVAVHLACQSLLAGECDLALAGGVAVNLSQPHGYRYVPGGIVSPDGRCRAFDAGAQGTIFGSGAAIVVLKRLADAVEHRDTIVAVIKGSATNNDGSLKAGYTAPSVQGQTDVIAEAQAAAGVDASTIAYVEAHGTGTAIGDPIEIEALTRAFRAHTPKRGFCAIASLKSNVGHLDAAAGVAGLVKAALALTHRAIPPSLHFERPNPRIDFDASPFYVNTTLRPWPAGSTPRRAAVSSFGIGGTNAHVILEEAPPPRGVDAGRGTSLLVWSARTAAALDRATDRLAASLREADDVPLPDVAYTLQVGRRAFGHRRALVCADRAEALRALAERDAHRVWTGLVPESAEPRVAFLFPGQGAQHVNMARGLYEREPVFRAELDRCFAELRPHLDTDLRGVLYPPGDGTGGREDELLRQTHLAQPALFAIEYALAQLLAAWGIRPHALVGHSLGEYVAACIAGVFALDEALALVAARGRLMQEAPPGAMLAVPLPPAEIEPALDATLALAAVNTPSSSVVSGPVPEIAALEERLRARGVPSQRLHTSHAFHSPMMDSVSAHIERHVRSMRLGPPRVPFVSSPTGTWIDAATAVSPAYWARQLRQPVRMADALRAVLEDGAHVLLEVGPGHTLCSFAQQHPSKRPEQVALPCMRHPLDSRSDEAALWEALGRLWIAGVEPDWPRVYADERRRRVRLATYPFERRRYWVDSPEFPTDIAMAPVVEHTPTSDRRQQIADTLRRIVSELSGMDAAGVDPDANFAALGLDSLMLLQVSQAIGDRFRVPIALRQFFQELPTVAAVSAYIDEHLPADAAVERVDGAADTPPAPAAAPQAAAAFAPPAFDPALVATAPPTRSAAGQIMMQQLQLLTQQMALLQAWLGTEAGAGAGGTAPIATAPAPPAARAVREGGDAPVEPIAPEPFVPYQPLRLEGDTALERRQREHLAQFVDRYTAKTRRSKERAQDDRSVLANNRAVAGFRLPYKEIVYPIVARDAAGSRFHDVDGNEYVDISMGFGAYLFGHNAPFIRQSLEEALRRGAPIGPFSSVAGAVARLVHDLTGVERVAFFNSGTEAVMVALRLARAVTGRAKVALFAGSFHGTFDGILVRHSAASGSRAQPLAPGIPAYMADQVLVLHYGTEGALAAIRAHAHELAAVLVEPVQSRRPDFQPREFLHELRAVTRAAGIALVFDEVITGFRIHPGGAQAHFGVEADLVTYGKVIGGGMPIGVVAGTAAYMDSIDGGHWSYGDASYPPRDEMRTFVAGTFCHHPLAMAGARAVLERLRDEGPALQRRLGERTAELTDRLNAYFAEEAVPIRMVRFGSLFRFVIRGDLELLFYQLIDHGIYIWEGRNCFLSTAHSDDDLDRVVHGVRRSIEALRDGGFLPAPARVAAAPSAPHGDEAPDPALVPLTEEQKQLWLLTQVSGEGSSAYNEPVVLGLRGALRVDALRRALESLVERHEALRMTPAADGEHQVVRPPGAIDLPVADFSATSDADRAAEIEAWLRREGSRPFDFARGPLIRVHLVRQAEDDHLLLLLVHHLVADDWSRAVLLRELGTLYSAACDGTAAELPEPVPFRAFVAWQRRRQDAGAGSSAAVDFWRRELAASPRALELPADRPRPAQRGFTGARRVETLAPAVHTQLRTLCAERNATPFAVLLSAFTALLHRLTGQRDVLLAVPTTGQPSMGASCLVGQCITMLPFQTAVEPTSRFTDHLRNVNGRLFDLLEHQHEFLRAMADLERSGMRLPELTVMFNVDRPVTLPAFAGLRAELRPFPVRLVKFDLSLNCVETDEGLQLQFDYRTDLFERGTIDAWIDAFLMLVRGFAEAPERSVGDVALSAAPRQPPMAPLSAAVHERVESQARRTPGAYAVVAGPDSATYEEINEQADDFAANLRRRGLGAGDVVALALERPSDLVTCLLGVLKAGCAFSIVPQGGAATGAALLVSNGLKGSSLADRVLLTPIDHGPSAVVPGPERVAASGAGVPAACVLPRGDGTATGVTHSTLAAHCEAIAGLMSLGEGDRVLSIDPRRALATIECILPALVRGATLVFAAPEECSLAALHPVLLEHGVTVLDLSHGQWRQLAVASSSAAADRVFPELRCFVRGSVPVYAGHWHRWTASAPRASRCCFGFAPDSNSLVISAIDADDAQGPGDDARRWPVGRPLPHASVSIRDAGLAPLPTGAAGELCLEGAGTPAAFDAPLASIEPAWGAAVSTAAASRRTGIRIRWRADGSLDVVGAAQDEVWIRGRRVEPGDVAAALAGYPQIEDAAVVVERGEGDGEPHLVACYAAPAAGPSTALARSVRAFLRERLADCMVPAAYARVERLTVLDHGGVSVGGLQDAERHWSADLAERPRTALEEQLAAIWSRVLGVASVGVDENFFELGGHSLLATALAAEVEAACGVALTLRDLFQAPTVAALAALVGDRLQAPQPERPRAGLPALVPEPGSDQPFPLTDVQQAYWVGRTGAFGLGNVSTHAYYELDSARLDLARFERAWQRLVARHGMLRAIVLSTGEQRMLSETPPYRVEVEDLRGCDPQTAAARLDATRERMSHQVLPSDRWPLFEIRASRLDEARVRLHISIDALIVDAWSMQILFREVARLYEDPAAELPPLAITFRDYVLGERRVQETDLYRRAQEYWQRRLPDLPPAPELPIVRDASTIDKPRFVRWAGRLEAGAWTRLKSRARRAGLTPSAVLLAAYAEVLALWSRNPQFTINLTLFNRLPLHPQVVDLVGDFTSVTLLAVDGAVEGSFESRARRLQERLWEDLDHRAVSGVHLLRELARSRQITTGVLMPVVFTSALIHDESEVATSPMTWMGDVAYAITQTPQVWLDHEVYEDRGSLVFTWDAVAALFPDGVVQAMFDAFSALVRRLAGEEHAWTAPWAGLARELVPAGDVTLAARVNATAAPVPAALLQTLFTEQAACRPLQPAVIAPGRTIAYQELDHLTNGLGRRLRELGARRNTLVAVVMQKGWEQVAATLAILKAGAAYLPIDPALPRDRILYLLEHGEVTIALTERGAGDEFPWPPHVRRIAVDGGPGAAADASPLDPVQRPDDLAYVIFTSGSTGLPKGVMIDHRGAVNTILDVNRRYGLQSSDRVFALSSLSFDLSVYDVFGMLAAGGTVVMPDASATRDPARWVELLDSERVTIWNSVPAFVEMLVEHAAAARGIPSSLRLVLMSGDWIPVTLPDRIRALCPDVRLVSLGGATEASIWSILHDIARVDPGWTSIPYGRPMASQTVHVFDDRLEPRPVWVSGHLYISGAGVAKGYWRDEARTRASFITHPRTGETLYRTGDLGRRLPDGTIEFLGREDAQVKVQGHRIELGEIEAALAQHPQVRACVVAALGAARGPRRLVAYVVRHADAAAPVPADSPLAKLHLKVDEPNVRDPQGRPVVPLAGVPLTDREIEIAYVERRSYRAFHGAPLDLERLSGWLSSARQWKSPDAPLPKYRYGSAGSLYPVQIYVQVKPDRVEDVAGGLYYYHPRDHALVLLAPGAAIPRTIFDPSDRATTDSASVLLFLVADLGATRRLYPEDALRFATLEAGLLTQLLETTGPAAHIGLCQIGKVDFAPARHLFALGDDHVLLHVLAGGPISPQQRSAGAFAEEQRAYRALVDAIAAERTGGSGDTAPAAGDFESELRAWLRQKIPEYMVPSAVVLLDSLPLSPNGKVDRKALPPPDEMPVSAARDHVAPRSDLERDLVRLLEEILGTDRIGVQDNFFDLGGTSVDLIHFHNRLQQVPGGRSLPIVELFRHPTVSALAERLGHSSRPAHEDRRDAISAGKERLGRLLTKRT